MIDPKKDAAPQVNGALSSDGVHADSTSETTATATCADHDDQTQSRLSWRPFPVEVLPECFQRFVVDGAAAFGCDPAMLALPMLAQLGAAIGNTRRLRLKSTWHAPGIIWALTIAPSGSMKTPPHERAIKPLQIAEAESRRVHAVAMDAHKRAMAEYERQATNFKRSGNKEVEPPLEPTTPTARRYMIQKSTVEAIVGILKQNPRGLLLQRSELSGWVRSWNEYKSGKGSDDAFYIEAFDGNSFTNDLKGDGSTFVPAVYLCICGTIQPGTARDCIFTRSNTESGMAARFLVARPPQRAKVWTNRELDPKLETFMASAIQRLTELEAGTTKSGEPEPGLVVLSPEAQAVWIEHYNEHNERQVDLDGGLGAAWSKLEGYAARLALVVHFARWASDEPVDELSLDAEAMRAGVRLARWFGHEAERLYVELGTTETEEEAAERRFTERIERLGGTVPAREFRHWPGGSEVAARLVAAGRAEWIYDSPSPEGGQGKKLFRLLPPPP